MLETQAEHVACLGEFIGCEGIVCNDLSMRMVEGGASEALMLDVHQCPAKVNVNVLVNGPWPACESNRGLNIVQGRWAMGGWMDSTPQSVENRMKWR